jgi:hypothetical protein
MRTLVLNQSNIVQDGQNNKLVYNFPNSVLFKDSYIAVSNVSMYYSWFNISTAFSNNTFSYTWTQGATTTTYTVVVPNGLYEIQTLNEFLQFTMINNGTYLVSASGGLNVYFAEFILNPARYAVQINTYQVPTSFAAYASPAPINITTGVALVPPTQTFNPVITLPAQINQVFGYAVNFATDANTANAYVPPVSPYISKNTAGTLSYISTTAPNVQPNSSVLLSCSAVDNPYAQPTSIIYSITPSVAVGAIINEKPPAFMWNRLINGTYNQLRLVILGTNLVPLAINDPAMTIVLVIKDKTDEGFS